MAARRSPSDILMAGKYGRVLLTMMQTSDEGLRFIRQQEGCVLHIYRDQAGLETVGVGHLLTPDDKASGRFSAGITEEQAIELLRADVGKAEAAVGALVKVPLAQHQFDALVSFAYNAGAAALGSSTLLRLLNSGNYGAVPSQLLVWDKVHDPRTGQLVVSPGLLRRRQAEATLWSAV